jgi:hypothetical protein
VFFFFFATNWKISFAFVVVDVSGERIHTKLKTQKMFKILKYSASFSKKRSMV